jgi:hypothetical protein
MVPKKLDPSYLESFFGDTSEIRTLKDEELKDVITEMIKIWTKAGDFAPDTDPTPKEIFKLTRDLFPYIF